MDKGIGLNRSVYRTWLDETARLCLNLDDPLEIRDRLEDVVSDRLTGVEAKRKTIDVLLNIWYKSEEKAPAVYRLAQDYFQHSRSASDRIWLHYGLTLLYYAFFQECVSLIGKITRLEGDFTNKRLKKELIAQLGQLGSLERSARYVVSSLKDWGVLVKGETPFSYQGPSQRYTASHPQLEAWLLTCALHAHSAEELSFADLSNLPLLFPFKLSLDLKVIDEFPLLAIHRQGLSFDMVSLAPAPLEG